MLSFSLRFLQIETKQTKLKEGLKESKKEMEDYHTNQLQQLQEEHAVEVEGVKKKLQSEVGCIVCFDMLLSMSLVF